MKAEADAIQNSPTESYFGGADRCVIFFPAAEQFSKRR